MSLLALPTPTLDNSSRRASPGCGRAGRPLSGQLGMATFFPT